MNTELENVFWDLLTETRRIEFGIGSLNDVLATSLKLLRQLRQSDLFQIQLFRDKNYDLLLKIKMFMVANVKQLVSLRSAHDNIFNILDIINNINSSPRGYTVRFEEFIKGITYFSHQQSNVHSVHPQHSEHPQHSVHPQHPVYHRLSSCGPRNKIYRQKHIQCNIERKQVKKILKHAILSVSFSMRFSSIIHFYTTNRPKAKIQVMQTG